MNILALYGSEHRGSTYNIARLFIDRIKGKNDSLTELFLPRDMPKFCVGCSNCFIKSEEACPHREYIAPIAEAIDRADLLVVTAPVYVLNMPGQLKALLDHFGYRFIVHRPAPSCFTKTALIVSTAAGSGMKPAMKTVKDSLDFWGVAKVFRYGKAVAAVNWEGVSTKKKEKITREVETLSKRIARTVGKAKPNLKTRALFYVFRFVHHKFSFNPPDRAYWREQGWVGKKRPWKTT